MNDQITITVTGALIATLALTACADPVPENRTEYEAYEPGEGDDEFDGLDCVPDLNGKLESDELEAQLDTEARFLVSPAGQTRAVDLAGESRGDRTIWDWSEENPDDQIATIQATDVDERWYADDFPDAEFVMPFDLSAQTEAVYSKTDDALRLHGIASRDEDPEQGQILLPYDEPVDVYQFPIEEGGQWTATGEVSEGIYRDSPYAGEDTYEVEVSRTGEMELPDFRFEQAHRVDTKVTVEPATGRTTTTRQTSFLFECFGEIARATSEEDEENRNFETAAEVRRLGL